MPILIMTSDTREATIKRARDAGANMVIAKPMSPASLYDRLGWIAFNPRKFVDTRELFRTGPAVQDRRLSGRRGPPQRRQRDRCRPGERPRLAQDDIDNLFSAVQTGQDR